MTLYEELSHNLKGYGELYRIQGGLSKNSITVNCSDFLIAKDEYLYVSQNIKHHHFFLNKRIKQLVDKIVFDGQPTLTSSRLKPNNLKHAIKTIQSCSTDLSLESFSITFFPFFIQLLQQNSLLTADKEMNVCSIERVDVKKGGGYGLKDEWLELLCKIIVLVRVKKITNKEIIEYLRILNQNFSIRNASLDPYVILATGPYNYAVNSNNLYNPYLKYDIINLLETILEKGLALKTSDLYQQPKATIKGIVNECQGEKIRILRKMESISQKNLSI